ncbi:MAG: ferric reductase-like transmembrane domain-containing protein [Opitutaceae bacterium]
MSLLASLLRSKLVVWTLIVLPGLWPAWPIFVRPDSSVLADPLKYVLHHLGFVACILLVTVLTFSPLRVLWPKSPVVQSLNRHRRLVGVSAFVYAALHLTTHLLYEGAIDPSLVPTILRAALTKPFQLTGLIAFTILLVLAITSLHVFVRWLGGKRWKNLHRLVYIAAGLVAYHQIEARKIFPVQVLWIFIPLLALEVARFIKQRNKPAAGARVLSPAKPAA